MAPPRWVDTKPRVSYRTSNYGWRVEVWAGNLLLYSEIWDHRPTFKERRSLERRYRENRWSVSLF